MPLSFGIPVRALEREEEVQKWEEGLPVVRERWADLTFPTETLRA